MSGRICDGLRSIKEIRPDRLHLAPVGKRLIRAEAGHVLVPPDQEFAAAIAELREARRAPGERCGAADQLCRIGAARSAAAAETFARRANLHGVLAFGRIRPIDD